MKTGTLNSKEINVSMRIDGSFHLSDGVMLERAILKHSHKPLIDFCSNIFTSGRSKRVYTKKEHGYPYLSNSDVVAQNPFDSCNHNSRKYGYDESAFLKEGMVLTGRVGAIGQTAYVTKEFEEKEAMGSDNIIRIVAKSSEYSGYIYSFLSSRVGNTLLWKLAAGGVQPYITDQMVKNIPVPIFPESKQKEIHNLIVESANFRVEADRLLNNAENELLKGINTNTNDRVFDPSERIIGNIFQINKGQLSTLTFRARNYSQRKQLIINKLTSVSYDKLIQVLEYPPHYGLRFKRIEAKRGYTELLSQGDIFNYKPIGRKISTRNIPFIEKEIVKKGTILIPGQGTLGENEIFARAKFIWGYLENKLVAGHAMRFVPNKTKIGEGYLFAVLSSKCWFRLLRNSVYGTNLLGFIVPMINDYPIPRFGEDFENQIDSQVKKAYEMYTKSISKENQAISLVEKEIESWQQS
jgi:type I restriction enzyme, S subunit